MKRNIIKTIFSITALFIVSHNHAEEISFEQELKQGCAKIPQYKQLGQKFYNQKNYKKALEQFQNQAAWTPFCQANGEEFGIKISDQEIDIANNNVGLTYSKLGQPMWARAWFKVKQTRTSQFNLTSLAQPKISTDLSGEYVKYDAFGEWDHISITRDKTNYSIGYSGVYMGIRSLVYGPNMGEFDTNFALNKKRAFYKNEDCTIQLDFKADKNLGNYIQVKQDDGDSGCGFGHNVNASGTYYKVEK